MAAETTEAQPQGFYSTTSGTYFSDKDSLAEHYKSDFHKYNLKRKVAGLPPVTKEWFDSRKEQLSSTATVGPVQKLWYDPLTKKKFSTENTYMAHVASKKYKDLLKKTGQDAPAPIITVRRADATGELPESFVFCLYDHVSCNGCSMHASMHCCKHAMQLAFAVNLIFGTSLTVLYVQVQLLHQHPHDQQASQHTTWLSPMV